MTPTQAYQHLVHGEVEQVSLDDLAGRVVATAVVPYPPGIPMLMPGEEAGAEAGPYLDYLKAMQAFDRRSPGFEHETHGVEKRDGAYVLYCLT
jgi:arginine decarboxylase